MHDLRFLIDWQLNFWVLGDLIGWTDHCLSCGCCSFWMSSDDSGGFGRVKLVPKVIGLLIVLCDCFGAHDTVPIMVSLHIEDTELSFRVECFGRRLLFTSFSGVPFSVLSRAVTCHVFCCLEFLLCLWAVLTRGADCSLLWKHLSFICLSSSRLDGDEGR